MNYENDYLPNREQIQAISDLDALLELRDEAIMRRNHIDAQLEFRDGTHEWESRAIGALAAVKSCLKHIEDRIYYLRGGKKAVQTQAEIEAIEARTERNRSHKEMLIAQGEAKALAVKTKLTTRMAHVLSQVSFTGALINAMVHELEPSQLCRVLDRATAAAESRFTRSFEEELGLPIDEVTHLAKQVDPTDGLAEQLRAGGAQ